MYLELLSTNVIHSNQIKPNYVFNLVACHLFWHDQKQLWYRYKSIWISKLHISELYIVRCASKLLVLQALLSSLHQIYSLLVMFIISINFTIYHKNCLIYLFVVFQYWSLSPFKVSSLCIQRTDNLFLVIQCEMWTFRVSLLYY